MTAGFIEQLRQLGEQASGGPWFVVGPPWNEGAPWINAGSEDPHGGSFVADLVEQTDVGGPVEGQRSEEDAAFIVAARNLWDPLLAVAEAAEALYRAGVLSTVPGLAPGLGKVLADLEAAVEAAGKEQT